MERGRKRKGASDRAGKREKECVIESAAATCQSINKMQIFASFLALFCVAFATCHMPLPHVCVATLRAAAAVAVAAFELQSSA